MEETFERDVNFSTDENFPESEDGYQQAESPGTKKLQHLATTNLDFDEPEVSAKLMERPISSGSAELQGYKYAAAPKRDLHIAKKPATALFGTADHRLETRSPASKFTMRDASALQVNRGRSPLNQRSYCHSTENGQSKGHLESNLSPPAKSKALHANDSGGSRRVRENTADLEVEPDKPCDSIQTSLPATSRKTAIQQRVNLATPPGRLSSGFSVMPISKVGTAEHAIREKDGELAGSHQDGGEMPPTNTSGKIKDFPTDEQATPQQSSPQVVDLTVNDDRSRPADDASENINEDCSPTPVGGDDEHSSDSEPEQPRPKRIKRVRTSVERESAAPKTPLQAVGRSRVHKQQCVPQQQLSLPQSGGSGAPTGRTPSEEDLYYLLLHRYRKREQSEKHLAARLRQLENENTELFETAQEYQQQLESSITSNNKQAAEIRAQKMLISDIKNRHSKIKKFMADVYKDQKSLKTKATSINQDSGTLRAEHEHLQHTVEEARHAVASSSEYMNKIKMDLAGFRQENARLETSLHDTKCELQNQQNLLARERRRNTKYENHIADITRDQNSFRFTIQREQQNLLNALQSIKNKIASLEIHKDVPPEAANLPALDQCVEMLQALTNADTATSAEVTGMVRAVQGLSESFASFQEQSEASLQLAANARAESDSQLLSQITEQLNTLVHASADQNRIADLHKAKTRLEERVRGNEDMLTEIRNGKASAEKRESDLRAGNSKIVEELAKLREMVLTPKQSSSSKIDHQALLMKWTNINSLLAESLQKIESKDQILQTQEERIQCLSAQLSEARTEQQKSMEEIQRLSERLPERFDETNRVEKQLLAEKETLVRSFQEELKESRSICSDQAKEIEEVKSAHRTLANDLDEAKRRLRQEVRDCIDATSTVETLNEQLLEMDYLREQADCVPRLVHDLEVKGRTIVSLQQQVGSIKVVKEQLYGHRLDIERKAAEISELNQKLQTAEEIAQRIPGLEGEVSKYKEEIEPLKDAHERVKSLEEGMVQKNEHINQLNIKVTDLDKTLDQLNDMRAEMDHYKDNCESMETKLKATEEEIARIGILEKDLAAREEEISKLKTKLTEAEAMSRVVPEMQTKMDQFSETFSKSKSELEDAQQAAAELHSIKAANATLQQTLAELQEKAVRAEQTSNSVEYLGREIRHRDAQIAELQERLAHLEVDSQSRRVFGGGDPEKLVDEDLSQDTCRLVVDRLAQQENTGQDNARSAIESETVDVAHEEIEPRKKRKCAERSASGPLAKANVADHEKSATGVLESTDPAFGDIHKTVTDETDEGHASAHQQLVETDLIPESQPRTNDHRESAKAKGRTDGLGDTALSSSPLSDVGDLFDSPIHGRPSNSQRFALQEQEEETGETNLENATDSQLLPGPEGPLSNTKDSAASTEEPSQERRPPTSSYGDSLLFDDLEELRSWSASDLSNVPRSKRSAPGTQEVLTSPPDIMPRKRSRKNTQPRLTTTSFSKSDTKTSNFFQQGQDVGEDTSPKRLRRKKSASQNDTTDMRPDTPSTTVKEKHQPNSAIKRKADTAGIFDDMTSPGKKSARQNSSNLETLGRAGTRSRSVSSSMSSMNKQALSAFRQTSVSSKTGRSRIIGKNAPTPGGGKQGSKKPRGGSRTQASDTTIDSEVSEAENDEPDRSSLETDLVYYQTGPGHALQNILSFMLAAEVAVAMYLLSSNMGWQPGK